MMRQWRNVAAAAAGVLVMAGCGGNPAPGAMDADGGEWVRVTVQNDGAIAGQVRVYLEPVDGGMTHDLGTLATLGTGTVERTLPEINGTYRLRAVSGDDVLVSPPVSMKGNEGFVWDMRRNVVTLAP